jgi:uncharacterized membrane protein
MSSYDAPSSQTKPGKVAALGVLTLISGISNILAALILTISVIPVRSGLGVFCAPVTLLPLVLGVAEIVYAAKLLPNSPKPVNPSRILADLEIGCVLFGNVIAVIVGIVARILYRDEDIKKYFAFLNAP